MRGHMWLNKVASVFGPLPLNCRQVVSYGGFYDNSLEWVGLEGVQVVGSLTGGAALGRHQLSTRFTSVVRIASMGWATVNRVLYTHNIRCILYSNFTNKKFVKKF